MKKVVGMSMPRSGSTYIFDSIGSILEQCNDNHVKLEEICRKINMSYMTFNIDGVINVRKKYNVGMTMIESESRKRANELIKQISDCEYGFSCKFLIHNLWRIDLSLFDKLLTNDDITTVYVYRQSILDSIISHLFSAETNAWNFKDLSRFKLQTLNYSSSKHYNTIKNVMLIMVIPFISIYHSYKWDYVISYDDLTGDLNHDFSLWFSPEEISFLGDNYFKKISTKEEKLSHFNNYETFLSDFKQICEELNLPEKLPITRSDLR